MPANVDISYPHAGDIVGTAFPVGGTYDASGLVRKNEKGEPVEYKRGDMFLGGEKITVKLYSSTDVYLASVVQTFMKGEPTTGTWAQQFSGVPVGDNSKITAILEAGFEPVAGYPRDTVEDVDIANNVGGGLKDPALIVLIPPP